jgi:exosome complex component CSL4
MSASSPRIAAPGDDLGSAAEFRAGAGTYARGGRVFASVLGVVIEDDAAATPSSSSEAADAGGACAALSGNEDDDEGASAAASSTSRVTLSVSRSLDGGAASSASAAVPHVGATVVARVLRISSAAVSCEVLLCEGRALAAPFQAVLRREHVRESEVDKVVVDACFRPGDLVQALVASLGDARSLFLSTVRPEHGVVWARSEAGNVMRRAGEAEFEDPVTGLREQRKVALITEEREN